MLYPSTASNVRYKFAIKNTKTRYEERRRERCRWLSPKIGVDRSRDHGRRSVHVNRSVALNFSVTSRNSTDIHYVTNGNPGNSGSHRSRRWAEQRQIDVHGSELYHINLLFVMAFMTVCYPCSLSWILSIVLSRLPVFRPQLIMIFTQEFRSCAKISILWVFEFYYLILIENQNDMKPKFDLRVANCNYLNLNINQIYSH